MRTIAASDDPVDLEAVRDAAWPGAAPELPLLGDGVTFPTGDPIAGASRRLRALAALSGSLPDALGPAEAADLVERQALSALGATSAVVVTLGVFPLRAAAGDQRPPRLHVVHAIGLPAALRAALDELPLDAPVPFAQVAREGAPLFLPTEQALGSYALPGTDARRGGVIAGPRAAAVSSTFTASARWLGIGAALGAAVLSAVYAAVLAAGLLSLPSPEQPIAGPLFTVLELLILLLMPALVALMVAVHAWAPPNAKAFSLMAVVFAGVLAGITCSLHFVILVMGRRLALAEPALTRHLLSFEWPSVAYALDVLAWDVFFALSALCAAPAFGGSRLARWVRALLVASGALALAGLGGAIVGDMRLRNIGIVGYAGVFPVAAALVAALFHRAAAGNR